MSPWGGSTPGGVEVINRWQLQAAARNRLRPLTSRSLCYTEPPRRLAPLVWTDWSSNCATTGWTPSHLLAIRRDDWVTYLTLSWQQASTTGGLHQDKRLHSPLPWPWYYFRMRLEKHTLEHEKGERQYRWTLRINSCNYWSDVELPAR